MTKLANELPLHDKHDQSKKDALKVGDHQTSNKRTKKAQKKLTKKLFNQIITTQKYLNPANTRTLQEMQEETLRKDELAVLDSDTKDLFAVTKKDKDSLILKGEQRMHGLYGLYLQQINNDMIELADKHIDSYKKAKESGASAVGQDWSQAGAAKQRKTSNALRKPQHSWWKTIDNSYD